MRKLDRKGQLTIFIIIGIALLFSTALIIYIRQSVVQNKPPVEIAMEQIPTELQPLQTYVTSCLETTAKEAIKIIGVQGGYSDTSKLIINDQDPTSGSGISMSPGSDMKIPYWYYMKSSNKCESDCVFDSNRPTLYREIRPGNSIEEQIDKYVEQKLSSCLADFAPFKNQLEIEQSSIKASTSITKTDVFVSLDYPISVKLPDRVEQLSKFVVQIPVNLGKFYEMATEITNKQSKTGFLDFMAMNLIDIYSGVDKNKLPPIADSDFGAGSSVSWMQSDVKKKVEEALTIYTPALQTTGSLDFFGNYYTGNSKMAQGLYTMFVLPLNKTYAANADFVYLPWWPIYLKVTPSSGEIIKPNSAGNFLAILSSFAVKQYKFAYDVSYPVLVTLSDKTSFGGEGFTFQFALESNTRSNYKMTPESAIVSSSGRPSQTMVCDPENFNSGNITIEVTDSITNEPLDGALVYYSFGKEACFIGETQFSDGKAQLVSKMPVGIGALLVSKENYLLKSVPFGTKVSAAGSKSISLDKFVSLNMSVQAIPVLPDVMNVAGASIIVSWTPRPPAENLHQTYSAVIVMSRIPENPIQEEYVVGDELKGNESRTKSIVLVAGNYSVSGTLIDNQKTIIPQEQVCYDDDWYDSWGMGEQKCETLEEITFDKFMKGGVELARFEITPKMLKDKKEIVINVFSSPDGYTLAPNGVTNLKHKDLEQMGKAEEYSQNYFDIVKPVFK